MNLPLHISPLDSSQRVDTVLLEDVQTERVNTLLVHDDEALIGIFALAHQFLQFNNLGNTVVNMLALRLDQFLSLFSA